MVLCSRNAVRSNMYTSGMWVLLEVKKAPVHDDSYQAMVILLLANFLNPKFKPSVVMTDLRDSWVFFSLEAEHMALCSGPASRCWDFGRHAAARGAE